MRPLSIGVSLCALLIASVAFAAPGGGSGGAGGAATGRGASLSGTGLIGNPNPGTVFPEDYLPRGFFHLSPYKDQRLLALMREGVRMRRDDGGKLTAEHRAYLQAKLDAIEAPAK